MEAELEEWRGRLKQVDRLIEAPARSLLAIAQHYLSSPRPILPSWMSQSSKLDDATHERSLLVHALVCSTLQRLWRTQRRYAWLSRTDAKALDGLQELIARSAEAVGDAIASPPKAPPPKEPPAVTSLNDPIFGNLNPFVAAEVFWILLHAGRNRVVGGTGFLTLFAMLWALLALKSPSGVGDSRTLAASVAAKCLRPLVQLQQMFRRRARLYREIRSAAKNLDTLAADPTPHNRWKFACAADWLSGRLLEMSKVAINAARFEKAAARISGYAKSIQATDANAKWPDIRKELLLTLLDLRVENEKTFGDAIAVLTKIHDDVLPRVRANDPVLHTHLRPQKADETPQQFGKRMSSAASQALALCRRALAQLAKAVSACRGVDAELSEDERLPYDESREKCLDTFLKQQNEKPPKPDDGEDRLRWTLARLADANDTVADLIEQTISGPVTWCRFVVRQEVAYASAGNDTEFDAAELLSAVAIAERSGQISELEVEDAIAKALRSLRQDGSWSAGQPIYLKQRVLGVWPNTSDIAWLLAGAATGKPKIRRADDALMAFVEWLDRTRVEFERHMKARNDDSERVPLVGWSSETRESRTLDLWITAGAISALLEIRDLIEHRLWELCERRFFVIRDLKSLDDIDPVDLGSRHEHRIHRRLRKAAREANGPNYRDAEYSFVFHGPPGSSKTAMAEALGREIWRDTTETPRVVRITPADFTRRGEAGLDAEARFIFELLTRIRGATIIFDEIDDLLRRRELKGVPAFLKMVVPAMLNRLQDLRDAAPRQEICYVIAMNYVDNVEPALIRPGRIDAAVPVVYPDPFSRDNTLDRLIAKNDVTSAFTDRMRAYIVDNTRGWPWPLFNRLCEAIVGEQAREAKRAKEKGEKYEAKRGDVMRHITNFETQKQDTRSHYAERERWTPVSPELVNEVAHFAFAFGRAREDCAATVSKIFPRQARTAEGAPKIPIAARPLARWQNGVVKKIREKLDTEWDREARVRYDRDAAMVAPGQMGATRLPPAQHDEKVNTVFRFWEPTAVAVCVELDDGTMAPLAAESESVFSGAMANVTSKSYRYAVTLRDRTVTVLDPWGRETDEAVERTLLQDRPRPATNRQPILKWHERLIYQVHPQTCSARRDYDGIIQQLARIKEMGFNTIDLVGPGEAFERGEEALAHQPRERRRKEVAWGGFGALQRLVHAAHALDLSVIAGVTSHDLLGRPGFDITELPSYVHFDARDTKVGPRPDFHSEHVRRLLCENARRWLEEVGVDGLRWAHTSYVHRAHEADKKTTLPDGWAALRIVNDQYAYDQYARPGGAFMVAQDLHTDDRLVSRRDHCAGFNAQWSGGFERCVRAALGDFDAFAEVLRKALVRRYHEDDAFARIVFAESHDTARAHGRLTAQLSASSPATARQRSFLATALALVTGGIPMILQGQELMHEPELDADEPMDFTQGGTIERRLRDLIALRLNRKGNTVGLEGHESSCVYEDAVVVLERWWHSADLHRLHGSPGNHTIVVANFNPDERMHTVAFPTAGKWHVRFNSHAAADYGYDFGNACEAGPEYKLAPGNLTQEVCVGGYGMVVLSMDP